MASENHDSEPGKPPISTWAILLARWTQFARSAVAFPQNLEGDRWRATVAPAIGLQAVTFAVADLNSLPPADRPLALDMAGVLTRRHAAELNQAWRGQEMPPKVAELIDDAIAAIARALAIGLEWTVSSPSLVMPRLDDWAGALISAGFQGDALAAAPGTILFCDEPAIFLRPAPPESAPPPPLAHALVSAPGALRQIYRQVNDATGRVERDLIALFGAELPPGRPLLTHLIDRAQIIKQHDGAAAARWRAAQEAALGDQPPTIVRSEDS